MPPYALCALLGVIILVCASFCFKGSSAGVGSQPPAPPPLPAEPLTVACFGDSTTYGTPSYVAPYVDQRMAVPYPLRMTQLGDVVADNFGINGMGAINLLVGGYDPYSTGSAYPPFAAFPLTQKVAVFGFGLVEAMTFTPPATYKQTMRDLINIALAAGKVVVIKQPNLLVVGVHQVSPPVSFTQAQRDHLDIIIGANEELAEEFGLMVAPVDKLPFDLAIDMWDRIHPNQDFANRIAEMVRYYVRRAAGY